MHPAFLEKLLSAAQDLDKPARKRRKLINVPAGRGIQISDIGDNPAAVSGVTEDDEPQPSTSHEDNPAIRSSNPVVTFRRSSRLSTARS